ncbi:MAG: dihydrolipoamide acetyltransferase [Myxococcales bacterium]|nr:dihydrolipoamide acetyltransferase [Myxococcales bacterium]
MNELKERIFRTKTRLAILKETVLSSSIAGSEARLVHRNEMGSSFRLEKVTYSLDGTPIFSKVDKDGDLDGREEIEIFNGPIVPGNHTVSVVMVYRGNGYGIFSYLRGYVFTLRSSNTFHAEEGKQIELVIVGYEKGGITTDLKDRPDIRFDSRLNDVGRGAAAAAAAPDTDG